MLIQISVHSARNRPRRLHRETGHFFMVSMASKRGEARLRRSVRALLDLTSSEARTGGAFAQPSPTDPNPEPILPTPAMALPLFPPAARPCFAATQHLQSEIDHDTTPWVPLRTPVPVPMQSVAEHKKILPTQSCPPCLRSRGRRESWAQENRDDRHFDDRPSRPGRCARSLGRLRSFPPPWSHPTTRCSRAYSFPPCFCRRSRGANGT